MPPKGKKGKKKQVVSGNEVTDAVGEGLINKLNLAGANLGGEGEQLESQDSHR
jgi:hypothetical protein